MLLNGAKLLEFIGQAEAPVALQCPKCESVRILKDRWLDLQDEGLEVPCECGHIDRIPRFSPRHHYPAPIRVRRRRGMVTLLGYAAVAAVGWQLGRRASGSFFKPSEKMDD